MARLTSCPSCQRKLQVPDDLFGVEVRCPSCSTTFMAEVRGAGELPPTRPDSDQEERPAQNRRRRDWADEEDDYYGGNEIHRRRRRDFRPHRGATILVLGILSLVLGALGLVLGPIAWILGNSDLKAMRNGQMDPEGEALTNAGRVCGMVASIIGLVLLGICFLWFTFAMGLASFGGRKGF